MTLQVMEGVYGTDSQTPLFDPEPFWREYSINDIFRGGPGKNKIIPKLGDHVRDPDNFATYRVTYIDTITYVPTLERIYPEGMSLEINPIDKLIGVGLNRQTDAYRLYVNNDVYPYVACVDASCKVSGTLCKYARVFKIGADGNLEVISKIFDSSGQFVSDKIPLELVSIHQVQNYSTKVVPPFKFTQTLNDNDHVVVYFYSDSGNIVSKQELLVEETAFVRTIDSSLKYVTSIGLRSPYISLTDPSVLNFPLHTPVSTLNIKGVVNYSDGSTREYNIDGGKFRLEGLSQLLSSIEGQTRDMVALYRLDSDEGTFAGTGPDGRTVEAHYKIVVSNENLGYSVKLFPVLEWGSDFVGYRIHWYLINMDRNLIYDVTDKIEFNEQMGPFKPFDYGYVQRRQVSVNLRSVSNAFRPFNHTQVVEFVLYGRPSTVEGTPWTIRTEGDANVPTFGTGLKALKVGDTGIDISQGYDTIDEWLENLYYNTAPLVDSRIETKAPRPTHFKMTVNGIEAEYSINRWKEVLDVGSTVHINGLVLLKFFKRTGTSDMHLAVSGLSILED